MSARRKRKRRNRIMATSFLSVIIVLCIVLAVLVFQNGRNMDLTCAFSDTQPQDTDISFTALLKAEPFAADLCVSDGDVDNSAISLNGSEKGALFNVEKKQVMFGEQMFEKVYPASITKIMTAILAVKYGNMDDTVTITEEDITLEEGSQMVGFAAGDTVTMDELFHGLLVYSGNDCAMAIARHIGGTVEQFVEMMNNEARSLGATGTHFISPHGLHNENHYTTVYDIYLMLNEALTYPYFVETMQLGNYTISYQRGEETLTTRLDATDHYLTGEEIW